MAGRRHRLPLGPQRSKPKRWYEKGNGPARLAHDKTLVATHYPTLEWHTADTGEVSLKGFFAYDSKSGLRDEIKICVVFPALYPEQEPRAYDEPDRFPHTLERHFYKDSYREGRCCLWLPPKSKWNARDPDALLTFLDEVVMFFERQLIFDATGRWPGPQYEHGYNGYKEWIVEMLSGDGNALITFTPLLISTVKISRNDLCPCRSGRKYKKCHLGNIEYIRRAIDSRLLLELFST